MLGYIILPLIIFEVVMHQAAWYKDGIIIGSVCTSFSQVKDPRHTSVY